MKLETKSGNYNAEIIGYLNAGDKNPVLVILTSKDTSLREIHEYTNDLMFAHDGSPSGLDLTEVKNENNKS